MMGKIFKKGMACILTCALLIGVNPITTLAVTKQHNEIQTEEHVVTAHSKNPPAENHSEIPASIDREKQWNLNMVSAPAENTGITSDEMRQIVVAVLDSGVSFTTDIHVAKSVNLVPGEEHVLPFYEDVTGHGTSVAGVIAALDNGEGTTGVNPDVTLYSVRVLDDRNQAPVSRIIKGIHWCIENDVNIINMSFGTATYSTALHNAIKEADKAGILIVASAGDDGTVQYPAAFPEVIAVGGINAQGESNESASANENAEILAPAEEVPAVGFLDMIIETEGTSMSAPHVTGAASILWAKNPDKSADFIRNLLVQSTRSLQDDETDAGVLDVEYALECYDDAAVQETRNKDFTLPENTQDVESYDEAYVNGLWAIYDHMDMYFDYWEEYKDILPTDMAKFVKIGIKRTDSAEVFKKTAEKESFHGYRNYVSNTVYIANIAKKTEKVGMGNAILTTPYAVDNDDYMDESSIHVHSMNQIKDVFTALNTVTGWNNALIDEGLTNKDLTSQRKAYFILGVAAHNAMDAFAHRTYVLDNGEWKKVKEVSKKNSGDDTSICEERWIMAKYVTYELLNRYKDGQTIDAGIFYQPNYNQDIDFKLDNFKACYNYCSGELYTAHKTWIDQRSHTP